MSYVLHWKFQKLQAYDLPIDSRHTWSHQSLEWSFNSHTFSFDNTTFYKYSTTDTSNKYIHSFSYSLPGITTLLLTYAQAASPKF